jgi:2-oxoglutarate dehydrogenase E2 component (dihydrolipoamide succinyltransferase)
MRVDVVMPQMGESIAEGTITRWIKKPGDTVRRDEPIFEISTDKVDAEIPSPSAGTLIEVRHGEGETVAVNQVVAVIETEAGAAATAKAAPLIAPAKPAAAPARPAAPPPAPAAAPAQPPSKPAGEGAAAPFVSPVVRKIADEHGIDPSRIAGTGAGGRVTKKDILDHVAKGGPAALPRPAEAAPAPATAPPGAREQRVAMTPMRKKIADHMVLSKRTSAHVHSVFEADLTRVVGLREKHIETYAERHGARLTYMPFFLKAVCDALRAFPILNASVEGDEIVYHRDLNIGIAVALDWGLIVPVIRNADELSVAGLARKVNDLADRARAKKLNPDEVHGGTFTVTNFGMFGGLFGLPIINQPQVGILGTGGVEKRPVVIHDAIAIRWMAYLALSFDHRVVDGAVADQFLRSIKGTLEGFDDSLL